MAFANAGIIAEQPAYTSYSYAPAAASQTLVQPVAYSANQYHHAPASSSSSFTKTVSYSQPKAYIAQPAAVASYHSYEPQQYAVSSYHHEPEHQVYAAQPVYGYTSHGSSEQNIVRSSHGTVSHISKAVDTPHSSVRKYDTRIVNDGYKTLSYAQPAAYVQPIQHVQPAVYAQQAVYAQPLVTKTIAQPVIAKTVVSQPITQYSHQYAAQPQQYQTYAQHAPVLATKVHYSPAIEVAHASFESPVAHYSW